MFTYNSSFNGAINKANLILYINGVKAELNQPINVGDVLRIEPLKGYKINTTALIS